jgi:hypothetical protein
MSHGHGVSMATGENRRLGELGLHVMRVAGLIGLAGLAVSVLIALVGSEGTWERFFRSYLVAFMFVLSLSLGSFFFVFIQHLTRAGWSVTVRRVAEGLMANMMWIWVLFIPLAVAAVMSEKSHLYEWAIPGATDNDPILQHKEGFLNIWFWLGRAAFYFFVWALFARFYYRNSVAQDASGDPEITSRMQTLSAPAAILFALTLTFAAIDWIMTLEPHWFSTMWGVYFFAASCCGGFSAIIITLHLLQKSGRIQHSVTSEHFHDLGKMLFAFGIVFWAYIGYSQYMLIWYANLPEETIWYIARQMDGWLWISLLLLLGHFLGPFLILISRWPKRWTGVLAVAAGWMLFIHYIDVYWMVMPRIPPQITDVKSLQALANVVTSQDVGYGWHLLDLTCLVGLLGVYIAGTAAILRQASLVPERDPRLPEALSFENV